jgi:hypothetical protein
MAFDPASDISHVIQLAVAPVFLLAGIGAFINAFAARLGRIFDRSRVLPTMVTATRASDQPYNPNWKRSVAAPGSPTSASHWTSSQRYSFAC